MQTAPAPTAIIAPAQPATCELHVWPAVTTHTTFQGWTRAGAVDGARRGVKGYPDLRADALDTPTQARLLQALDWSAIYGDPTVAVVIHTEAPPAADDRTRVSRLIANSPPCYRELIVLSSIIESEVFSSRSVRILALRKRFDGATGSISNFSSMSQSVVVFSDADKAASDSAARMDAALRNAYSAAVRKFAVMQTFN